MFYKTIRTVIIGVLIFGLCGCSEVEEEKDVLAESEYIEREESLIAENETVNETTLITVSENIDKEAETPIVEEDKEITISLAGDCSLGKLSIHGYEGTFYEMYDLYGADYFFKNVYDIFKEDDLTLVNFEGVLTESDEIVEKQYNIKGEPEYNRILEEGSIEAVSFGNNHRIDYGQQGIDDTITAFNEVGVVYAYDDNLGLYETPNGVKVGFVSVNEVYDEKQVEVYLEEGIMKLKEEADLILACCHWGEETHHYPESYQTELGRKCIDWGADLVVGCHPHVLQGIDYYNGKYIIYSLGNFCFGGNRNPKDKNTMIVQADVKINGQGTVDEIQLSVIPCTISSVSERNDYCPTIAEGNKKEQIIEQLNQYSKEFGVSVSENCKVIHE